MPFISVDMRSGRTQAQREMFAIALTDAAQTYLGAARHSVIIRFTEHEDTDVFQEPRGGNRSDIEPNSETSAN